MSEPTIAEIDEHLMEERQRDKRYFPLENLNCRAKTPYFDYDAWVAWRKQGGEIGKICNKYSKQVKENNYSKELYNKIKK